MRFVVPPVLDLGTDRAALATFALDHDLLLVDWCAAQLVAWDQDDRGVPQRASSRCVPRA